MSKTSIFGSLLLATATAVAPLAAADRDASFELRPGVVVDRDNGRIYSMKPGGGLQAIDSRTGTVIFESALADKPVALWNGQLAAQRESLSKTGLLEIVLIDTRRPDRTAEIGVTLPDTELALVDDSLGRKFSTTSVVRDGQLLVGWTSTRQWMGAVQPEEDRPLREEASGAVRLDVTAGKALAVDPAALEEDSTLWPAAAQAFAAEPNAFGKPLRVGALVASTQTSPVDGGGSRVVLKRWKTDGLALPDVEMFRGEPIVQWPSADHRHLIISQRVAPGERDEYLWNVYSLETGARVGQLRNPFSKADFYVDGPRLIHEVWPSVHRVGGQLEPVERAVQAVRLSTGAVLWNHPLRETSFRGPFPP